MAGFLVFCVLVAMLVERTGVPAAFVTAALAAVGVQALLEGMSRPSAAPRSHR
jgi:hypothetical protein